MPATHADRLVVHLTDGDTDRLAADLRTWVHDSRRFRAFADAHRDKIRKKVRATRGEQPRLDLRAELAVPHALLDDRRIELAYEGYGATVGGPDFTVSFRSHMAFNLEVTRWRGDPGTLRRQLAAKLRQLPPGVANVVLVAIDADPDVASLPDFEVLARSLLDPDDRTQDREAHKRIRRLSGLFAWAERRSGADRTALWMNPAGRIPLPEAATRAVLAALRDTPAPMDPRARSR
jgi:hypothetical protein